MKAFGRWAALLATAASLAGCAIGGMASIQPAPEAAAPPPIAYGAFLDGPVGQKLAQADRDKALAAEQDALAAGQRKTWRGEHGVFGYVEPAATGGAPAPQAAADGVPAVSIADSTCRAFTSTIYIAGRPQIGHGRGCQNPDGSYRIVG